VVLSFVFFTFSLTGKRYQDTVLFPEIHFD